MKTFYKTPCANSCFCQNSGVQCIPTPIMIDARGNVTPVLEEREK